MRSSCSSRSGPRPFLAAAAALVLASLPCTVLAQTEDVTPPELTAFNITPTTVNVLTGSASVTITCAATDDLSGPHYAIVHFRSPSNAHYHQAICWFQSDGTATATATFGPYIEPGAWKVSVQPVFDGAGNGADYPTEALAAKGFTSEVEIVSNHDEVPPELTAFNITPTTVNVLTGSASVTITCAATDDVSGPHYAIVHFRSPSNTHYHQAICWFQSDGTATATATFGPYIEPGAWKVSVQPVFDGAGNGADYPTEALAAMGFTSEVEIISNHDEVPPELTAFTISPTAVNTSNGPATVTITCAATDDVSGPHYAIVHFRSPSNTQYRQAICWFQGDGTATTTVTFGPWTEVGTWKVSVQPVFDGAGNGTDYPTERLAALGFSHQVMVANTVTVAIDIKPGSADNPINPTSSGKTPVAILSGPDFDALGQVSVGSLTFGRTGDEPSLAKCNTGGEDVDGDRRLDLVCHFDTRSAGFQAGDILGVLKGLMLDGTPIKGTDAVRLVK